MADKTTSQDSPKPGKPEAETVTSERQAEAAAMQARLTAEEQAGEAADVSFRLAEELSARLTDALQQLNEIGHDAALMQVDILRRLAGCRTAEDLAEVHRQYWQAVFDQAVAANRRIAEIPMTMMPALRSAGEPMWQQSARHMERASHPR